MKFRETATRDDTSIGIPKCGKGTLPVNFPIECLIYPVYIIIGFLAVNLTSDYVLAVCGTMIRMRSVIWQYYCHDSASDGQFKGQDSQGVHHEISNKAHLLVYHLNSSVDTSTSTSCERSAATSGILCATTDRYMAQPPVGSYEIAIAKPCVRWQLRNGRSGECLDIKIKRVTRKSEGSQYFTMS
jgi:hypothetical protein